MQDEKTEKATPKRRADARKKGQVAKSREIGSVLVLLMGISILFLFSSFYYRHLTGLMVRYLEKMADPAAITLATAQDINLEVFQFLLLVLSPLFFGLLAISLLSQYLQVGFFFSTEQMVPKLSRMVSFGRLFSGQAAVELLKSLGKIVIVGTVAFLTIQKETSNIVLLLDQEVGRIFDYLGSVSFDIALKTILVMLFLAAADYFYQRWQHEKSLRMSRQDLKEEEKQTEGDPLIKARIRSIQRQMARKRMMAEVPKADVVITNPSHLAVALYYDKDSQGAPQVVAKGAGFVAERIKEIARKYHVPVLENKPLARVLFKTVEIGQLIPATLYQMVADVLAFVYRLQKKNL
jgi:flagellar biosynthesis protein FlhB